MAADARIVLEKALAKVEQGAEDDAYLRDAVRASIQLLGGMAPYEDDDSREVLVPDVNDLWDGTGRGPRGW